MKVVWIALVACRMLFGAEAYASSCGSRFEELVGEVSIPVCRWWANGECLPDDDETLRQRFEELVSGYPLRTRQLLLKMYHDRAQIYVIEDGDPVAITLPWAVVPDGSTGRFKGIVFVKRDFKEDRLERWRAISLRIAVDIGQSHQRVSQVGGDQYFAEREALLCLAELSSEALNLRLRNAMAGKVLSREEFAQQLRRTNRHFQSLAWDERGKLMSIDVAPLTAPEFDAFLEVFLRKEEELRQEGSRGKR